MWRASSVTMMARRRRPYRSQVPVVETVTPHLVEEASGGGIPSSATRSSLVVMSLRKRDVLFPVSVAASQGSRDDEATRRRCNEWRVYPGFGLPDQFTVSPSGAGLWAGERRATLELLARGDGAPLHRQCGSHVVCKHVVITPSKHLSWLHARSPPTASPPLAPGQMPESAGVTVEGRLQLPR